MLIRRFAISLLAGLVLVLGLPPLPSVPFLANLVGVANATETLTARLSVSTSGAQGNGGSDSASVSGDGRWVAFSSSASNLVDGDTSVVDVFVRDVSAEKTSRVSLSSAPDNNPGNNSSIAPDISGDGQYVAFWSEASNIVPNDTNATGDIFVRDRVAATTSRISVSSSGSQGNGSSSYPAISWDGRYVVFESQATNLVPQDTNGTTNIFLHDRTTGATSRASVSTEGYQAWMASYSPDISSDGRYVTFHSADSNLVPNDTNARVDVFLRDTSTGTTSRVSLTASGSEANFGGSNASISEDGRHVAFSSSATNLVSGDTNAKNDIFVRDRATPTTTRASVSSEETEGNNHSWEPAISGDGRFVAFESDASNLESGDTNNVRDIFVRDRAGETTTRVSQSSSGAQANGSSRFPAISSDGRWVDFHSSASNLVANDTNNATDVFGWDPKTLPPVPEGQTRGGGSSHADPQPETQSDPVNSATGSFLHSVTDISLPGIGLPFVLTRTYNSGDTSQGPLGQGWSQSYAASLTIGGDNNVTFRGEDGQQLFYTRQPDGTYVGDPGVRSKLKLVGSTYELIRPDQVKYTFNSQGKLTKLEDRNAQDLVFAYDGDGKVDTVTDTAGRVIDFTHNGSGLLTGVSLPDGRSMAYGYTTGRLTSFTDLRGKVTAYGYDGGGRLATVTDPNNHTLVTNTYGGNGRVTEQVDALGNHSTFAWDSATQTSTMTDARGNQWKDVYSNNVLVKRIDPLGNTTTFDYDRRLNLTKVTDPRGKTTILSSDARGNLVNRAAPNPLGYEEWFAYDSKNNLTSAVDGRGKKTTFEHDAAGNLIKITRPGSNVTQFGRHTNGSGLLTSLTDPRGKVTQLDYDASGNLAQITTPLGNKTTMGYDSSGRMTSLVEPRGNVTGEDPNQYKWIYTYNNADRLLTQTDPLGQQTSWSYDDAGNLTSRTDAKNRTTTWGYNAANELTSVSAPGNIVTSYAYDVVGNLTTRTDAKNHVTTYGYDQANRLTSVTSPIGQLWTYEYDTAGNLTKMVDATGNATQQAGDGTTTYTFDALNRLAGVDYSDTTPDVTFAYDANSNRTSMTDGAGTESYTHGDLNRLTAVTRGSQSFAYEYNAAGSVTKRTYPDGTVVDYTFDDDGRLSTVASGGATTTYGYDEAANLTSTALPASNGYVETRIWDRAGQLTEVKNAKGQDVLSRFTHTLDEVGNPTQVVTPTETIIYEYDDLDRLTKACFAPVCPELPTGPFIRYEYDDVGNRTTETRLTGTITYSYNNADQLTSTTSLGGTVTYQYDTNGNQTAAGARTFTYDLANRMKSTTSGSTTITYSYDGDGKRLEASSGAQASDKTKYVWDRNAWLPLLIRESEGADALLRRYVHGVDLISMSSGGSDFFFHYDPLGSVSNVTSSSGAAQWTHTYEPFGASRTEVQNDPSAPTTLMRFTGELIDSPTGLYHLRARQYDPVTGRFTSTDPLAPALNDPYVAGYVYANNRPTLLIDPSGMRGDWKQDCPFWGRLLTFGEWENVYCEGFLTMDPTWQGIWGATIQAAPPALAVALLGRACVAFSEVCARLSVKIWIHGPNHNFPGKGPRWHLFLNWWLKGVDRSHHIKQIPFPW